MPKVNLSNCAEKEAPPIDWLWAAVLERKTVLGYDLKQMADIAGVTYETMRHYIRRSPWTWLPEARGRVCMKFGIKTQVSVAATDAPNIQIRKDKGVRA